MKLALIGDFHLGCGWGTERERDSFRQAAQALEQAVVGGADLVVLLGDVYDTRIPRQEVWAESFSLLQRPLLAGKSGAYLTKTLNRLDSVSPRAFSGIPVVALHGNHDSRGPHAVNPIQALEQAGFLTYLHKAGVVFEKDGERVCLQGMSWVPDEYAQRALHDWKPTAEPDCYNLFLFHQSMPGYVYSDDEKPLLHLDDLPKGFGLYASGHLHVRQEADGVVFPGSTVVTQQKREEALNPKGLYFYDTRAEKLEWVVLEKQRPFYYDELRFEDADAAEVLQRCRQRVSEFLAKPCGEKPVVRLKLCGTLRHGSMLVTEEEVGKGFDAVISLQKSIETEDFKQKIEQLRELHRQKVGVEQLGMKLLDDLLAEAGYKGTPPQEIIDALAEGEEQKVVDKIIKQAR